MLTRSDARPDSPVLGFYQDSSTDPLHNPSPDYIRDLPDHQYRSSVSQSFHSFLSNLPANIPPPPPPPTSPRLSPSPLPPAVIPGLHKRASALRQDSIRNALYVDADDVNDRLGPLLQTSPTLSPRLAPEGVPEDIPEDILEEQHQDPVHSHVRVAGDPLFMTPMPRRRLQHSTSQVFFGPNARRDTRTQMYLGVPSTHTPVMNINAYKSMPSSPSHSRSSDDSADTSGSAMFSSKRKMSVNTDSELGSPGTSPSSTSFDPKAGRRSFEPHPRHSLEPPPSINTTRRSSDSFRRPVVVVHRYADGQERIYRYRNEDGDGYETEYEQENVRTPFVPPTASHWSLGSSVVESVKTVKTTEDAKKEKDKENKDKDKSGKKKRLASFMSRLSLAPTHPDAPEMIGRWHDVEFVAPSPSRSRNRSLPLSVRAEMMREKERQRERDKQKVREQRERADSVGDNGDHQKPTPQSSGTNQRDRNERSDLHVEGGEHPQIFWEENQGQDLGYAPSSMSLTGSSTFTSHVVQTPVAFQSTPSSSSPASTQSWDARVKGRGRASSTASTPLLSQNKITGTRTGRARADSLSAATSLSSYANAFACTDTDCNTYPNINIYPNITNTNTSIIDTAYNASTSPYRLSFSTPTLPLHPTPHTNNTYTHTFNYSTDSSFERALPPLPLSPASLSSFTLPPSPLSASFKEYGYDLSTTTTTTSLASVEKIAPKGLGPKKASILNIRGLAARMMGVHNSNNNNPRESLESPSKSRSRSTSPFASRKDLHEYAHRYGEPDQLQNSTPFPLYGAHSPPSSPPVPPKKESKSRSLSSSLGIQIPKVKGGKKGSKEEKEKRKLVISGIEAGGKGEGEEAVRRWCEAFGEVRAFKKKGTGCLVVDFRRASVADMVCRVQAQVYIRGAGSVNLSWYTKTMMKKGALALSP